MRRVSAAATVAMLRGIGLDVRIAGGVYVALGTVEARWHIQQADLLRRLEIAWAPGLHATI